MQRLSRAWFFLLLLAVGFTTGAIFERRGWTPNFYNEESLLVKHAINNVVFLPPDTLAIAVKRQDVILGTKGPLITVYTNFECPFCARFDSTITELASVGKYRFSYRYLVGKFQETSYRKHRLVTCSRLAGLPIDKLVPTVFSISRTTSWSIASVLQNAGYEPVPEIEECVEGKGELAASVDEILLTDFKAAQKAGVKATPTWIMGNKMGSGALSASGFDKVYQALDISLANPGH